VVRGERDQAQRDLRSRFCYLPAALTKMRDTLEAVQLFAHSCTNPAQKRPALGSMMELRNQEFESTPLQQTVSVSTEFASRRHEARVFRGCAGPNGRGGRQRRARGGRSRQTTAISLSGLFPVPRCCWMRFARLAGLTASDVGRFGVSDLSGALSSDRLKQSRARAAARARRAVDVGAPAVCRQSTRSAGVRRGWLA
jgi:hypothetical protein